MFEIIDYSEKAIAIIGNTKTIKEQLKELGGRFNPRLTCGAGWVFPKSKRAAIESITKGEKSIVETPKVKSKAYEIATDIQVDILNYYTKVWGEDKKMIDHCVKSVHYAIRLSNGLILVVEKPSIKTTFCFGESGYDYDEAFNMAYNVARTEEYFKTKNLSYIDNTLEELKLLRERDQFGSPKAYAYLNVYSYTKCADRVLCEVFTDKYSYREREQLPAEDIDAVIGLYEQVRADFEKRINTYLKRYGTSRLKTRTYWLDA